MEIKQTASRASEATEASYTGFRGTLATEDVGMVDMTRRHFLRYGVGAGAALALPWAPPPPPPPPPSGGFGGGKFPDGNWRPYADSSPFNKPIGSSPQIDPNSASMITNGLFGGAASRGPGYDVASHSTRTGGFPTYWGRSSDPLYTIRFDSPGNSHTEGNQVHIPNGAQPGGGFAERGNEHDCHITLMDQPSGWEYDLWVTRSMSNGIVSAQGGGRTRIDGDGLSDQPGYGAVAANYGNLAGVIRAEELMAGKINHALHLVIPSQGTSGSEGYKYPASGGGYSGVAGCNGWKMGTHVQLNMTAAEIDALPIPDYRKAIAHALATYGAYAGDTTGERGQWGFHIEGSAMYWSLGYSDRWVQLGQSLGMDPQNNYGDGADEYWFDMGGGIPWNRLRVLA